MTEVKQVKDMIIIGGGPIGMFAAYYAGMRDLDVAMIETLPVLGGQIAIMYPDKIIVNLGGIPEIRGVDLVEKLTLQCTKYNPDIHLEEKVLDVQKEDQVFKLTTDKSVYYGKSILIATGQGSFKPRKLTVDGAADYEGKNLHYFVADTEKFRDKEVLVCGGGNSAVEWALILERVAKKVTLVHRRNEFRAHEVFVQKLRESTVEILTPFVPEELIGDGEKITSVCLKERRGDRKINFPIDELIISYGFASSNQALADWGLELAHGGLIVDRQMQSNIPGIFGAGDGVTYDSKIRLLDVGFGEVPIAINSAVQYINGLEE